MPGASTICTETFASGAKTGTGNILPIQSQILLVLLCPRAACYRGGSFSSDVRDCRSADRKMSEPEKRYINLGFRLAFSSVWVVGLGSGQ